jgi:hypothetical protein
MCSELPGGPNTVFRSPILADENEWLGNETNEIEELATDRPLLIFLPELVASRVEKLDVGSTRGR